MSELFDEKAPSKSDMIDTKPVDPSVFYKNAQMYSEGTKETEIKVADGAVDEDMEEGAHFS